MYNNFWINFNINNFYLITNVCYNVILADLCRIPKIIRYKRSFSTIIKAARMTHSRAFVVNNPCNNSAFGTTVENYIGSSKRDGGITLICVYLYFTRFLAGRADPWFFVIVEKLNASVPGQRRFSWSDCNSHRKQDCCHFPLWVAAGVRYVQGVYRKKVLQYTIMSQLENSLSFTFTCEPDAVRKPWYRITVGKFSLGYYEKSLYNNFCSFFFG